MSVGRNEPCPCGSGKKYKQCCLIRENKQQIKEQRREKFYDSKQELVEKIGDYLVQQVPIQQYNDLKDTFQARTKNKINQEVEEGYFTFWLYFFHHFDNGLRGIEWFHKGNAEKLNADERNLLENWLNMKARFLQAVDQTGDTVVFQDLLSMERFPVSKDEENLGSFYPWMSTLALLEPFDGEYYFNGFRLTVSPYNIENALDYFEELKSAEQQTEDEIVQRYFPELVAALLEPANTEESFIEVVEYALTYSLKNAVEVAEFLRSQPDMKVEEWEKDKQEFIWAGNWRICKDNACPGVIKLADAYGNLFLQNDTLIYVGIEAGKQQEMKERLQKISSVLTLEEETNKVIGSYTAKPNSVLAIFDEMIPDYFTFYAQNNLLKEIDEPIPMYSNQTIRQLVDNGREVQALEWLKNLEFNVYRQVMNQFEEVEVTADFNTVRRELGLGLSPFVTGGANRETTYEPIQAEGDQHKFYQSDIPYLEELGFMPHTVEHFYVTDLLRFYKERVSRAADDAKQQYRSALSNVRTILEEEQVTSWEDCTGSFWKHILPKIDTEQQADFLKVLQNFFLWLDRVQSTQHFDGTVNVLNELEQEVLKS